MSIVIIRPHDPRSKRICRAVLCISSFHLLFVSPAVAFNCHLFVLDENGQLESLISSRGLRSVYTVPSITIFPILGTANNFHRFNIHQEDSFIQRGHLCDGEVNQSQNGVMRSTILKTCGLSDEVTPWISSSSRQPGLSAASPDAPMKEMSGLSSMYIIAPNCHSFIPTVPRRKV
jgi:hypothetical protein